MIIEQAISIEAEKGKVFDYLGDFNNRVEFINYMDDVRLVSEKKEGLGVRYAEIATILGRNFETVYEVVAFDQNRFIKVKSVNAVFPISSSIELGSLESGTSVDLKIEVKLPFLMRVGAPLIQGFIDSEAQQILKKIKENVERQKKKAN